MSGYNFFILKWINLHKSFNRLNQINIQYEIMSDIKVIDSNTYCIDAFYVYPGRSCVYLIHSDGEYALVDCGTAMSEVYIMDALERLKVDPGAVKYILPTHVHLDHAGGAGILAKKLVNAKIYIHPRGYRHLIEPEKLIKGSVIIYGERMMKLGIGDTQPLAKEKAVEAEDRQELQLGNTRLMLHFTPGHANHHYGVYDIHNGNYFGGDVLGNSYAIMNKNNKHLMFLCSAPVQYDAAQWHKSLDEISAINPKRGCICHYGVIENLPQAIDDMHRLLDKNNNLAEKFLSIKEDSKRRSAVEELVWGLFWDEFDAVGSPMIKSHAREWMIKDVHISVEGVSHWLKQKLELVENNTN